MDTQTLKTVRAAGWMARAGALVAVLMGLAAVFLVTVRPWHRSWGASVWEERRWLPGDEIVPDPRPGAGTTHAITIQAPVTEVWLWIAQLGQDRGGFYSYEVLEDLVGCEMENTDRTHAEWQHWALGDKLWMYPPHKLHGLGHAVLRHLTPGRALGFATRQFGTPPEAPEDGSWSFIVEPAADDSTRLLIRSRAGGERSLGGEAFDQLVFEPMHFVMERRMMENIKAHAEGKAVFAAADTFEVLLWTVTFALGVLAAVRVFREQEWRRQLAALVASALVFQVLTFLQPSLITSLVLVGALAWFVWFVHHHLPASPGSPAPRGDASQVAAPVRTLR